MKSSVCCEAKYQKRPSAGFTLLEVLVVLVLTGLISTLLMQGLNQVLLLRGRFTTQLDLMYQNTLRAHWFYSSTAALIPDYPPERAEAFFQTREPRVFKGRGEAFSGLSLAALDADIGVPEAFSWQLRTAGKQRILEYHNSRGEIWMVMDKLEKEAAFSYLGRDGAWHDLWPPRGTHPILSPQIPEAVMLNAQQGRRTLTWVVEVQSRKYAPLDYRLMDF